MILHLIATAAAYESEPQDVPLEDLVTLFTAAEYDTGWWPSGSPLALRFQILSDGGADIELDGESHLEWPGEDLSLSFDGTERSGRIDIDAGLAAVTSIRFDVDVYSWESEIDRREIEVIGEGEFDPYLLDGSAVSELLIAVEGLATEVIRYNYAVYTGVEVEFSMDVQPVGEVGYSGVAWRHEEGDITSEGGRLSIAATGAAEQEVAATFVDSWTDAMDVVLTPTFSVCVVTSCTDLASVDLSIPLVADAFEHAFPTSELSFPLPVIGVGIDSYDFGEVEVGNLATLELPIESAGAMELFGEAGFTGSDVYSVFPSTFGGQPGTVDGVVVTFEPLTEGEFQGALVLSSNDPARPDLEIALVGVGVVTPEPEGDDEALSGDASGHTRVCGCGAAGAGPSPGAWVLVLASAALSRRRREAAPGERDRR